MSSTETEVCRAFRNKGKCKFGDTCKYAHTEGEFIVPPPRGQCFNFRDTGECKFAERCRFQHGDNDPRFDADGQPVKKPRAERKPSERKARAQRDPDAPVEKIDEVCNNYQAGKCRNGDNCRRIHQGDIEQDNIPKRRRKRRKKPRDDGEDTQEQKERVRRDPDAPREKIDEECKNYLAGKCRYGENCRRIHTGTVLQQPVEKIDEVCNKFQEGRCRFGDMCRRQHTVVDVVA